MTVYTPSPEQQAAIDRALLWFNTPNSAPYHVITGYAGTGKTYTINALISALFLPPNAVHYAAYTGKAASVMSNHTPKPATTIHSILYYYIPPTKDNPEPTFELRPDSPLEYCSLLILDECSMVDETILKDLLDFEVPILALGDPAQLPPIKGTGALFKNPPDSHLTTIHRQALGSPIIRLASHIRSGFPIQSFTEENSLALSIYKKADILSQLENNYYDQILCGKNATRLTTNTRMRRLIGVPQTARYPTIGERLCCLRNNSDLGIFNGEQFHVSHVGSLTPDYINLTLLRQGDDRPIEVRSLLRYYDAYFDEPDAHSSLPIWKLKNCHHFDFGYCLTVHKSQGSQWPHVLFIDDKLFVGMRGKAKSRLQLQYTAVTRASESLHVITP